MGLGACTWAAGELLAFRRHNGDTTTGYVRRGIRAWPLLRFAILAAAVWLVGHFDLGWAP